jgi:hypothetical protein
MGAIIGAMRITSMTLLAAVLIWSAVVIGSSSIRAQEAADAPRFDGDKLLKPDNYRSWVFLGAGLGMTYNPEGRTEGRPQLFTNVFVNPRSYQQFRETGAWPDKTTLVLEIRRSLTEGSINKGGSYQGEIVGIEAHVKDGRFPGSWAFFNFADNGKAPSAALIPQTANCYTCHKANAAVENTFVQFYPELMEIARRKGTVKAGYQH